MEPSKTRLHLMSSHKATSEVEEPKHFKQAAQNLMIKLKPVVNRCSPFKAKRLKKNAA